MPVFKGMSKAFAERLEKPAKEAGKRAGKSITGELDNAVSNLERQVKASESKLEKFAKASEAATAKQEQKKQDLKAVTLELQAAEEKYQKAVADGNSGTAELAKVEKAKGKVLKATTDLATAEGDAKAAAKKYEDQQKDLSDTSGKLKKAQEDAAKGISKTTDALGDGDEKAKSFKKSIGKIAVGVGAAIGAIGSLGKAAYELGASFDDAYDTIRVGTGASGAAFEGLQQSLRNVAQNSIGVGGDIAEIGTTLADLNTRLGVTGEPLEKLTTQFQQLQGMGIDADINKVTGALQQFGIKGEAAPAAMDDLFRISQATGRSITEITDNLSKSGPALQQFGFGLNESAGLLGALDKAGLDSEKTLGSMTKALSVFAKEGKEPEKALWGTIQRIDELSKSGKDMEAIDMANKIFGAKGGAGFVAAVKSGKFEYDDFMHSIGASGDTINGVAEETADFAERWDQFKLKAMLALEPVATAVFNLMVPALEFASRAMAGLSSWVVDKLIPAFKSFGEWVRKNESWIKPLAAVVGTLAAAYGLLAVQAKVAAAAQAVMAAGGLLKWFTSLTAVTKAQTAAQTALNLVMNANPIFLIVTAIAAVAAGLAVFFTKTEKGREVWQSLMDAFNAAWQWLKDTFVPIFDWIGEKASQAWQLIRIAWDGLATGVSNGWATYVQPVFQAFSDTATWLWETILQPVFGFISDAFTATAGTIFSQWEAVIKVAWDALSAAATWLWENVLQPTFKLIADGFKAMGDGIAWTWENIIKPIWDAMSTAALWLWENALKPVFDWIADQFGQTGGRISNIYNSIIRPVFEAFGNFVKWIWDNLISPTFGNIRRGMHAVGDTFKFTWERVIKPTWDNLGKGIQWVADNLVNPTFKGLRDGLDTLKTWFSKTVEAIGKIWDGLKEAAAKPVRFVVNTVWNNGILEAVNAVTKFIPGLKAPDPVKINFNTGGVLPGYTPGRDPYTFVEPRTGMRIGLSGGEAILRPEATRALGKEWVDRINAAARQGGKNGVENQLRRSHFAAGGVLDLGNFAKGGFTNLAGALSAVQRSHGEFVGHFFPGVFNLTSASRSEPGSYHDYSVQKATDWQNPATYKTQRPSSESKALARAIYKVFPSSAELIHWPLDGWQNLKHGNPINFGAGTNAGHQNHVHWATHSPVKFDASKSLADIGVGFAGAMGSATSSATSVFSLVKKAWDAVINKIAKFGDEGNGSWFSDVPGAFLKTASQKMWDFIAEKAKKFGSSLMGGGGGGARPASQWADAAREALRRAGYGEEYLNIMLKQIDIESSGNPRAVNNWDSNAAKGTPSGGLLQVIEPTYRGVRSANPKAFEGLPDDRFDPVTNLTAGVLWTKQRYGGPGAVWPTRAGYASGGIVDLANLMSAKLYDRGGWLKHGEVAVNKSGKPEPVLTNQQWGVLSRGFVELGKLVPAIKDWAMVQAKQINAFEKHMAKVADPSTREGVTARALAARFGEIVGMLGGESIQKVTEKLLSAEKGLLDAREAQSSRLANIAEKEKALAEARKALSSVKSDKGDSAKAIKEAKKESSEKIKEAEKALADARKDGKPEKIAKAEKNLAKIRKDTQKKQSEAEKKRSEDVKKSTDDVAKAEAELAQARMESVRNLDIPLHDLLPGLDDSFRSAAKLASDNGLGGVAHQLSGMAALTGPAGISAGMAIEYLKTGIDLVKFFVDMIKELVERIYKVQLASRQAVADSWEAIAAYSKLVVELQHNAAKLQQELVRSANAQRDAEFNLRVAQQDRLVAAAEGELAVARARMELDEEIRKGAVAAQLKLMGLHEDWDTYLSWAALEAEGVLEQWSDTAISALFRYEQARAQALRGELQARVEQIQAEAALAKATRENARNQQDLLVAQERLIRMSAKVAGVDLVEAQGGAQASKLLVELFEADKALRKNVLGRWGYQMGAEGSFANEYRGQLARRETLQKALDAVLAESGIKLDDVDMQRLFSQMGAVAWREGNPMDVIRSQLPRLVEAETALKVNESLKPIYEAKDALRDQAREVEDFRSEIDLYEKVTPLEETIKGLEYAVKSLDHSADAFAKGNEKIRGDYLRAAKANADAAGKFGVDWKLDPKYAGVREQVRAEYTIHMSGENVYTADEVDELLKRVTAGSNVRVRTVVSASDVAARRKELI
ncbi:phage tail tape measure protein [Corynebacterium macclintockiae]|uniref:phage tail tape measure protein n=1 Tax=Corynebacterium macclintockiae TaxID=2913501 RepID=UPI003EB6A03E